MMDLGLRVEGLKVRVQGVRFRVQGSGLSDERVGFEFSPEGLRVEG